MVKTYVEKVTRNLYVLRVDDDQVKFFEALWHIPEGITYNAYLLVTSEKIVLFDSWKQEYTDDFIEKLREIIDLKDIDYIIIHHMEQDHSGAIPKILELNNFKAEVRGHSMVLGMLEAFYNIKPKFKALRDGEEMSIGDSKLKFIYTPWLHWPDTFMTYIENEGVLLTGDAFGSYGIPPTIFDENQEVINMILPLARKYVINIVGKYRDHIVKNISKIVEQKLKINILAPLHGLIWRENLETIINAYLKWAKGESEKGKVVIIYSSMYGCVEKAVSVVVEELEKNDYQPIIFKFTDKHQSSISSLLGEVIDAEALIIATSTYDADVFPLIHYIVDLISKKASSSKPVLILSAYGWGGIAGRKIAQKLSGSGFKIIENISFKGKPRGEVIEKIRDGVRKLIQVKPA